MNTAPSFPALYNPETFRAQGHALVDLLAEHLAQVQRREGPVLPWREPEAMLARWPAQFPEQPGEDLLPLLEQVLAESHHLQHPRYVGHQCAAPLPMAALVGLMAGLINNGTAVYEMGPVSTAMERSVVRWLCGRVGFNPMEADGIFTHGGSAGNLTALLAARQATADHDVWEEGYRAPGNLVLVTGDQAHYSVRRSAQILGLGGRQVITIPSDTHCRMRPDALTEQLESLQAEGKQVMAVVASAGSTATGAIDPLEAIAEVCESRNLWMHVDGAHTGAYVVSDRLRPRLAGIERAHSVVIDAHKMMLMPSLATAVLFRNGGHSFETFSQQATYLFDRRPREEWYNLAHRTLECTKRMLATPLYLALQTCGTSTFATFVERMHDLAAWFAAQIQRRPHWELAVEPEGNILCFRHMPPGIEALDALQSQLRDRLVQEGSFHLVKTSLFGRTWLRTTLINPLTTEDDLLALLDRIESVASDIQSS